MIDTLLEGTGVAVDARVREAARAAAPMLERREARAQAAA